jgi:glucose/arabinose dehydrogenase
MLRPSALLLCLLPALLVPFALVPAQPPAAPKKFTCAWATGPITLDGKADEPAWKNAEVIDRFTLPWLKEKDRPARTATKARLLWDRDYLYFHADMEDTDLYVASKEHNGQLWLGDVFELFFKPAVDKPGYYEFQVNPAGTRLDMFLPRRNTGGYERYRNEGDFGWETKVIARGTINKWTDKDQGWSVEGRIPWTDFARTGGRPAPGEEWRFALCRVDVSVDFEGPELSTCAPLGSLNHPDFHHHEDYATLVFVPPPPLEGAAPRKAISKVVGSPEPPSPYVSERVYPKLPMKFPIAVGAQPGSDRILTITQPHPYARTRLERFVDKPDVAETEILLDYEDTAYDFTFHPKFAENGFIYVGHNGPAPGGKRCRITRYHIDPKPPYKFDPKSALLILDWASDGHNGCAVGFGKDGMLYITTGDGTSDSDTNVVGQGLDHLLAKVLRIDVDNPAPGKTYSVPKDNPFVNRAGARPETWCYGLRNPWRLTVDPVTGDIWVGQNGQDLWETAYKIEKGANYGWSVMEGSHPFYPNRKQGPDPITKPTVEHHHSDFRSLTGGIVYYGKELPDLKGVYLYGDYSTGKLWGAKHDGTKLTYHQELVDTPFMITGFGRDTKGELIFTDHNEKGAFYTLKKRPANVPQPAFPRKLSETGLFASVPGHKLAPELFRYTINVPFWSDGAFKERALYLPPDTEIGFTTDRGWDLPNGSVTVKSFALETKQGDPKSRVWIETRIMLREDNEWAGYTYRWNADQTDAELVTKEGTDGRYTIQTPTGPREQVWHYPSRAECMVCHSRAANFVLGLSTLQFNCPGHDGKNQLEALERRGWLKQADWLETARETIRTRGIAQGLEGKRLDEWVQSQTATRDQRSVPKSALLPRSGAGYPKLPDPYAPGGDVEAKARAWLHVNCSNCHVEAGGGNAQIDLEWKTKLDKMRLIDVKPQHHTFNLPEARLIAPGHPERSVLLQRVATRGQGFMPPLSTHRIDEEGANLLRDWIAGMKE